MMMAGLQSLDEMQKSRKVFWRKVQSIAAMADSCNLNIEVGDILCLPDITTAAASLTHHGMLGSGERMILQNGSLASVSSSAHLASLASLASVASCVTEMICVFRTQNSYLTEHFMSVVKDVGKIITDLLITFTDYFCLQ